MSLRITSNNHTRPLLSFHELPAKVREEIEADYADYVAWCDEHGTPNTRIPPEDREYVKAYGEYYDFADIPWAPDAMKAKGWDGFIPLSFWGGPVFCYFDKDGNLLDGGDSVIVGWAHITG